MPPSPIAQQWRAVRGTVALCAAVVATVFAIAAVTAAAGGEAMHVLTRDTTSLLGAPPYAGAVSTLGLIAWTAAATAALFGALVMRRVGDRGWGWRHLVATGVLSAVWLTDDAYLLHEDLIPRLGVPELAVLFIHLLLLIGYLMAFRRPILRSEYLLLGMATFLWGVSAGVDALDTLEILRNASAVEDAFKFSGIIAWTAYAMRLSVRGVAGVIAGDSRPLESNEYGVLRKAGPRVS